MAKKKSEYDSVKIEEEAVMAVKHMLNASSLLCTSDISMNDKIPSWDGNVFLYKTDNDKKKNNIDSKIPVQVKGKIQTKKIEHKKITYPIELCDLNNYYNDGGIVFFVVYLSPDFYKNIVYYSCLNRLVLKLYIDTCKNKKHNSISIELKKLPNNIDEISDIFTNFSLHLDQKLPEKKLPNLFDSSIQFSCSYKGTVFKDDPIKYFLTTPTTIYAIEPLFGTKVAVAMGLLQSFSKQCNSPVYIGNKKFFDKFESIETADKVCMKFGRGISIEGNNSTQSITINYSMKGTLTEVIQDLCFFKEFIENKSITINNQKQDFPVDTISDIKNKYDELVDTLNYYKTVKELFEKLEIHKEINIEDVTPADYEKLNSLIDSLVYNLSFKRSEKTIVSDIITICNNKIAILIAPISKNTCRYLNIYNDEVKIEMWENECPEEKFIATPCFLLDQIALQNADNINYEKVANGLNKIPISKTSMKGFELYCSILYKTYKKTKNEEIKNCITKIILDHNLLESTKQIKEIYSSLVE